MEKPASYQNFSEELENLHRSESDWVFGAASLPSLVQIPPGEHDAWLPQGEVQAVVDAQGNYVDMNDCATRGPINILEALFTYHYHHGMPRENQAWLEDNGYWNAGKITFSDRFIAILSGTTHAGNSLIAPLDSIHGNGLIPKKLLPLLPVMTWNDYYDKGSVTVAMLDLGKEFKKRFTVNYERVFAKDFAALSVREFLSIALFAWPIPVDGIYQKAAGGFNHCVALFQPSYFVFDNYLEYDPTTGALDIPGDFIKQVAPDYAFFDYGYRVFISAETVVPPQTDLEIEGDVFEVLFSEGLLKYFADWWQRFSTRVQGFLPWKK